jgi:hypothetical protein
VQITAQAGTVDGPRAAELRAIDVSDFADLLPPGSAVVAFEFAAELREGSRVGARFGVHEPNAHFVLTRFVQSGGLSGLEPRLRYASNEFGILRSVEPSSGPRLPGITGSGTYVLVRVDGPRALVEGVARDTGGQAIAGLAVTIGNEPWLTFSASDGRWQLVAPVGQAEVVVTDLRNGDRGTQSVFSPTPLPSRAPISPRSRRARASSKSTPRTARRMRGRRRRSVSSSANAWRRSRPGICC